MHMTPEIEQAAKEYLNDKRVTLEMLRDILCDHIQAKKRAEEAERMELRYGMEATEEQRQKWRRAYREHNYRMALAEQAIRKYTEQG